MKPHRAPSTIGTAAAMIVGARIGQLDDDVDDELDDQADDRDVVQELHRPYLVACSP